MSIIERVAELLGSVPQARGKPSAASEEADTLEPSRIERAAGDLRRRFVGTTRTLRVDLDRLRKQSIITPDGERTPIAEGFRRIKRQILVNVANPKSGAPVNLVLVTSARAGEGKTFCAINLAISIALEMDQTVLLVDADVAKPSIPEALGLEADKGLMDVLLDRRIDLAEVLWKTDIDKLTVLPAGTAHPHATELLASGAMRDLLREMATRYCDRIIIFDSPPLLAASEAGVLASRMGQIVMVVEAGKTTEAALKDALGRIESSNVAGLLLNKGQGPGLGYYYGGYG
jgi:exopolysaccharide/PEP-CTERM locus tyrosine autokinase